MVCSTCGAEYESTIHIFKECPGTRAIAFGSKLGGLFSSWNVFNVQELVELCIKSSLSFGAQMEAKSIYVIFSLLFYWNRNFKNSIVHNGPTRIDAFIKSFEILIILCWKSIGLANSVYAVEIAAVDWASMIAEQKQWNFILWSFWCWSGCEED